MFIWDEWSGTPLARQEPGFFGEKNKAVGTDSRNSGGVALLDFLQEELLFLQMWAHQVEPAASRQARRRQEEIREKVAGLLGAEYE